MKVVFLYFVLLCQHAVAQVPRETVLSKAREVMMKCGAELELAPKVDRRSISQEELDEGVQISFTWAEEIFGPMESSFVLVRDQKDRWSIKKGSVKCELL